MRARRRRRAVEVKEDPQVSLELTDPCDGHASMDVTATILDLLSPFPRKAH